jgi:hypothetical protein
MDYWIMIDHIEVIFKKEFCFKDVVSCRLLSVLRALINKNKKVRNLFIAYIFEAMCRKNERRLYVHLVTL